jgi:hypothetical protein
MQQSTSTWSHSVMLKHISGSLHMDRFASVLNESSATGFLARHHEGAPAQTTATRVREPVTQQHCNRCVHGGSSLLENRPVNVKT